MSSDARRRRAGWPVTRHRLGEEPIESLMQTTTLAERIAMVWPITIDTWASMNAPIPEYTRAESPGRIIRKHG